METQAICHIEQALNDQWLRNDIGANICSRRVALKLSVTSFSKMLDCNEKDLTRLEDGLLYPHMPLMRMQALMLLERLEARQEGRRNGDLKTPNLKRVK